MKITGAGLGFFILATKSLNIEIDTETEYITIMMKIPEKLLQELKKINCLEVMSEDFTDPEMQKKLIDLTEELLKCIVAEMPDRGG